MKKVAIYSRKSVYTEGSISIESQVNMCKEYMLKKFPNSTFEIFEDEGFSGGNTNRPAFKKMIKAAELKQIDIVVCYKIDRIARNTLDFLNILEMFKENNVELISITEGFDPNTQMGKVMLTLLASFAEMERANIQQRVKDSMFSLAQKGDWTGGTPPIGFKTRENGGLELENPKLILDIFNMKFNKLKNSEIIEYVKEKYNHTFVNNTLANTLRRPFYTKSSKEVSIYLRSKGFEIIKEENNINSYYTYKNNNKYYAIVSNDIEGLIEPEVWIAVNKIMDNSLPSKTNRFSEKFWLTKTLKCKYCGKTYCGQTNNSKSKYKTKSGEVKIYTSIYEYYMCRDMMNGRLKTCENTRRIKKVTLESKVEKLIYKFKDKNFFEKAYKTTDIDNTEELNTLKSNLKKINSNIDNLTNKLSLLSNEAAMTIIDKIETLISEKKILNDKILDFELNSINNLNGNSNFIYENIMKFNSDLSVDMKRNLAMNIFKEIIYDYKEDKFEVFFN